MSDIDCWNKAESSGDLRLKYNLSSDSLVIDGGAYKGEWAKKIHNRYGCKVYCFEPIESYFRHIVDSKDTEDIEVFKCAIGGNTRDDIIYHKGDGSSIFKKTPHHENIKIKSILEIMNEIGIKHASMLKLNVEGSEYEIMEALIASNNIEMFDIYQIQFHIYDDESVCRSRRDKIRESLSRTHKEDYNFEFIWESWSMRQS